MLRRALFTVALLAVLAVQTPAQAQWGCGYALGGYGMNYYGNGLPVGWYTGVQGRMPPYFALHPPVYYSGQIVRIPYGASPFATPWGVPYGMPAVSAPAMPAAASVATTPAAESVTIENEFYKREGALRAPRSNRAEQRSQVSHEQGLMIDNPFYRPASRVARNK